MMLRNKYIQRLLLGMTGILLGFSSCDEPFKDSVFVAYDEVPAAVWLEEHPEFSDWVAVLKKVERFAAFNLSTSNNTYFVADNDALKRFAQEENPEYTSIFDMPDEDLLRLVMYNTIPNYEVLSKNMIGKISRETASGDFLTAVYDVDRNLRYINNGDGHEPSYIIDADIEVINGYIHVVDRPLRPIFETVWDIISSNPNYSIFTDALEATDSLVRFLQREEASVYWGPEGEKQYYTYKDKKTVLVVPDYEYAQFGITSFDQFMEEYFPRDIEDPTVPTCDFFEYMLYHIFHKQMSYEDLTTFPGTPRNETVILTHMTLYTMSTRKGLSVKDEGEIIFNPQDIPFTINTNRKDIPGNNGYVHEITGSIMTIPERMAKFAVEIEFTDKIEFSAIDFYQSEKTEGSSADEWDIYPGDIPGISWVAIPMSEARVWYSNQYMAASLAGGSSGGAGLPIGENRYKNYDALYWDLGATGSITFDLPVTPMGQNYRMYVNKSNNPYVGGKYAVRWGVWDMGNDRNFMGGHETAEWGVQKPTLEETRKLTLRLSQAPGEAGIDRIVLMPEGNNSDL